MGNRKVGKTSITNRCVFDEFDENSASTRVVQIVPKEFNVEGTDKIAKLHIWDTLGQETFMSLAPLFFRRAVGAFLVYDVTSMESFQALERWNEQLQKNTDTRIVGMLIGNKIDMMDRQVPYNTAMKYAIEN